MLPERKKKALLIYPFGHNDPNQNHKLRLSDLLLGSTIMLWGAFAAVVLIHSRKLL